MINQLERLADQSLRDNLPSQRINSSQPRSQLARGGSRTPGRETLHTLGWMLDKAGLRDSQSHHSSALHSLLPTVQSRRSDPWGVRVSWGLDILVQQPSMQPGCRLQAKPLACTHCQTSKYYLLTLVSLQGLLKQHLRPQFEQRALQQMSRQTKTPSFD